MTSQEAEDKAREASIKNPDDIYYVAYDNIMEPASDIKWKNGKQIDESFNDNWNQRFKGMKVFINGDFQIKSVYFADGTEGWELGTWTDSGRYNVIGRFPDIDEAKQKAHDLKYSLGEDLDNKYELYNDYVITRDLAGDGYNVYSYDSYKDKLVLEDEGFATKQDAKNEIDKWTLKSILDEDIDDEKEIVQRYLDVEIPDILSRLIDFLPNMYESDIKIAQRYCRTFYNQLNSMLSYYVKHKDEPIIESNVNLEDRYNTLLSAYGRELRDLMSTNKDGCNDDKIKEMQDKIADTKKKISNVLKEHVEITALEGPKEGPKVGLSSLLTDAIKDEWEAIETYNSLAVTARAEGFEDIANKIDEINTDENTHVGKLQELLKTISPNAEAIELGEDEGKEQLDDINDDMSEDDVLEYTNKYM